MCERHLLRANIDALRVVAVRQQQPHQRAPSATDVHDRPDTWQWKRGPDIAAVDQSGGRTISAARVL
jgi:hypothetical protein